jgi:stearoyl-CoA desaturase (delta-9 desaturase)
MAPNITSAPTGVLFEEETLDNLPRHQLVNEEAKEKVEYKLQIVWKNVFIFIFLHLGALYGIYLIFTSAKIATTIFGNYVHPIYKFLL